MCGYKQVGSLLGCPHLLFLMGGTSCWKINDISKVLDGIPKEPKTPKQKLFLKVMYHTIHLEMVYLLRETLAFKALHFGIFPSFHTFGVTKAKL